MEYLRAKENTWKQSKNICKSLFTSVLLVRNCTCKLFFLLPFFSPEKLEDFSSPSRNIDVSYLNCTENWSNSWIDFFLDSSSFVIYLWKFSNTDKSRQNNVMISPGFGNDPSPSFNNEQSYFIYILIPALISYDFKTNSSIILFHP